MIKIETFAVEGIDTAIKAMRNPLDSWSKSDSKWRIVDYGYHIGEADRDLSVRLQKAGPEHCKHLRMIVAYADITAPLYWYKELDTYRAGVEKVSCSTMHTITKKEFEIGMFSHDHLNEDSTDALNDTIGKLNRYRTLYLGEDSPDRKMGYWWQIIQLLPSSFNQTRTYMFSYAALRSIYKQREGHKLDEWHVFREWCESLPESWMITE